MYEMRKGNKEVLINPELQCYPSRENLCQPDRPPRVNIAYKQSPILVRNDLPRLTAILKSWLGWEELNPKDTAAEEIKNRVLMADMSNTIPIDCDTLSL